MEEDGFILVKKSRKRRSRGKNVEKYSSISYSSTVNPNFKDRLDRLISDISKQEAGFHESLSKVITDKEIKEVVCYGIGRVGECRIAQHQFGVLVNLLKMTSQTLQKCYLYEPVLSEPETEYISNYMTVLEDNDSCCWSVGERKTLFYMIHCSKRMYDNVLKSNWDRLDKVVIIGNSFQSYLLHNNDTTLLKQVPHIFTATSCSTETPLPPYHAHPHTFNNTAIITFRAQQGDPLFSTTMSVDDTQDGTEIIT